MSVTSPEAIRIPALGPHAPASQATLERLAAFAERMLEVPVSLISLVDGERPVSSPEGNGDAWRARRAAPLSRSLDQYAVRSGRPLLIEDARIHPLVRENPVVWMGEVAYAGVPIRAADGSVTGSFCAIDTRPRAWTD